MSLSVNYPDLKPHIAELAELIARELEVNTSQVKWNISGLHFYLIAVS